MLWFKSKAKATSYSCEIVLYAKENHVEAQPPYEKFVMLKFDAAFGVPQAGLSKAEPLAHLDLKLTPEAAEALVPVLARHAKGVSLHPDHINSQAGPEDQPEIFVEGRKYKITIEPID